MSRIIILLVALLAIVSLSVSATTIDQLNNEIQLSQESSAQIAEPTVYNFIEVDAEDQNDADNENEVEVDVDDELDAENEMDSEDATEADADMESEDSMEVDADGESEQETEFDDESAYIEADSESDLDAEADMDSEAEMETEAEAEGSPLGKLPNTQWFPVKNSPKIEADVIEIGDASIDAKPLEESDVPAQAIKVAATPCYPYTSEAKAILALHNQRRRAAGRPALILDPDLTQAAKVQNEYQIRKGALVHTTPAQFRSRIRGWTLVGENVGYASNANALQAAWVASAPHRQNMMNSKFRYVGIATRKGNNGQLWGTVIFTAGANPTTPLPKDRC